MLSIDTFWRSKDGKMVFNDYFPRMFEEFANKVAVLYTLAV